MMQYSVAKEEYDHAINALREIAELDPGLWKTAQSIAERGLSPFNQVEVNNGSKHQIHGDVQGVC